MHTRSLLAAAVSFVLVAQAQAAGNQTTTEQVGDSNIVWVTQAGSDNAISLHQDGTINRAAATQSGADLAVSVSQQGDNNSIESYQYGVGSSARLSQQGAAQYQMIFQQGSEGSQSIEIDQKGSNSVAYVLQSEAAGSTAVITQEGDGQTTTLGQTERVNDYTGYQGGSDNYANVTQEGGSRAVTSQTGTDNQIDLHQTAWPFGASSTITQAGEYNDARIRQTDAGRYSGGDLSLTQQGRANAANVEATGAWSIFDYVQTGTSNQLYANQSGRNTEIAGSSVGDYNQVDIDQTGDNNALDLAQNGNDNVIEAIQGGWWGEGDIGMVSQTGLANFASITQSVNVEGAATNVANIMQSGMNNSATVVQGR